MYTLAFLSGIAFCVILLLAWSLCRASANAEERMKHIRARQEKVERILDRDRHDPC